LLCIDAVCFAAVSISSYLLIHPLLFHQFLGAITKKQTSIFAFKLIGCYGLETLLLLGLVFIFSVFFSHKINGPVNRFRDLLKKILQGDLSGRIILRDGDEFKALAESLNLLLEKVKLNNENINRQLGELGEKMEKVQDPVLRENFELKLAEIRKSLESFLNR